MKKILIPIELSHPEEEWKTVQFGARLAIELNMGLMLMSVINSNINNHASEKIPDQKNKDNVTGNFFQQEKKDYFHSALSDYQKKIRNDMDPPPVISFQILKSRYAKEFLNLANKLDISMFLLCWNNLNKKTYAQVDKTNKQILKNQEIPVLIHPSDKTYDPIKKIIFSTNYHPLNADVINNLSEIFNHNNTEIIALHVTEDFEFGKKIKHPEYLKQLKNKTNANNLKINAIFTREKLNRPNLIHSFAIDKDADMIAVLKENEKIAGEKIQPDVIHRMAAKSELPLMVFSA